MKLSTNKISHCTISFRPVARRITVMLRGPGLVHMRQTRQVSTMGPIALIASSGAPACRSSSDSRMLGACQKLTCNLLTVRLMTAGSRECSNLRACPRSKAVHSCVRVSSPVSVGPGIRSDLCEPLLLTRSPACSSAVFRGAGRRSAWPGRLVPLGPAIDGTGVTGRPVPLGPAIVDTCLCTGRLDPMGPAICADELLLVDGSTAGSASGSSASSALGAIFPTSSLEAATFGTRSMSLAGSRVMSSRTTVTRRTKNSQWVYEQ